MLELVVSKSSPRLLVTLRFLACFAIVIAMVSADPLTVHVPAFSARNESRLQALARFARQNRIPLAIEFSDSRLDAVIDVEIATGDARSALHAILGSRTDYSLSSSDAVVTVRSAKNRPAHWLDESIGRFEITRITVELAALKLWMTLERQLDATKQGFGGSFPPAAPTDLVGPMDLSNVTVRAILNRIIGESRSSTWMVSRPGAMLLAPASSNRFWTIMYRPADGERSPTR